jgi:hypothetical protein
VYQPDKHGLLVARLGNEHESGGLNNVCIPVDTGLSLIRFLDYVAVNFGSFPDDQKTKICSLRVAAFE